MYARFLAISISFLLAGMAHAAEGDIDTSFGIGGLLRFNPGGAYDDIEGMALQSDGSILAVGSGSSNRFTVARFTSTGFLDQSFADGGSITFDTSAGSPGVITLSDDSILLGVPELAEPRAFTAVKLDSGGAIDNSYGIQGVASRQTGGSQVRISSLALQSDGSAIAAGYDITGNNWDWFLTRFDSNGDLDEGFGVDGLVQTDFSRTAISEPIDFLNTILVQPDGKIVAGGLTSISPSMSSGNRIFAIARYLPDGTLDPDFGEMGKSIFTFETIGSHRENISDMVLLPDGSILAAAEGGSDTALIKIRSDGLLDETFGVGGRIVAQQGDPFYDPRAIDVDPLGRILAVSSPIVGPFNTDTSFAITRFLANGQLDPTFGLGGSMVWSIGRQLERLNSLLLLDDGNILVGGSAGTPNVSSEWVMFRIEAVPESSTLLLVGTGALLVLGLRRSRK